MFKSFIFIFLFVSSVLLMFLIKPFFVLCYNEEMWRYQEITFICNLNEEKQIVKLQNGNNAEKMLATNYLASIGSKKSIPLIIKNLRAKGKQYSMFGSKNPDSLYNYSIIALQDITGKSPDFTYREVDKDHIITYWENWYFE